MASPLSITVVDKDRDRTLLIVESVRAAGNYEVRGISGRRGMAAEIAALDPDLVLVHLVRPTRDDVEEVTLATLPFERPVVVFVDESDGALTRAAIEAGVSAYVVGEFRPERIKSVLDAAIVRFEVFQRMHAELQAAKRALDERKVIDRAKGLLMDARGITEAEAYALLRKTAMSQGRKIADLAETLVTASSLLS